jgi:hypothetical protein
MGYLSGSCPVSVLLQPYRVLLVVPGDIFPEGFKPVTGKTLLPDSDQQRQGETNNTPCNAGFSRWCNWMLLRVSSWRTELYSRALCDVLAGQIETEQYKRNGQRCVCCVSCV